MAKWKRYVVSSQVEGGSKVLSTEAENVKEEASAFYRVDLWCTAEMPVDNSIDGDRGNLSRSRAPASLGTVYRALEIPPELDDAKKHREMISKLHREVDQKHSPSEKDYARHPTMHRTDTLDYITCVIGEIYLMTDNEEVLMCPGDTVVIRGGNHGWSNRSDKPCLLVGVMVDAVNRDTTQATH